MTLLVGLLLCAAPLPPECEAPELRDVLSLKVLAQRSGSLSVGLDSVATWCFDSGGTWTAGQKPKGKKKDIEPDADPQLECAKAIKSCEVARVAAPDTTLMYDALKDLERPYLNRKYTPKRSGLQERPSEAADCTARARSELFTQAQARMDLARLAALAQNEYASYKQWLLTEGLRCAQAVRAGKVDPIRKGIGIDAPVSPDKGQQVVAKNASGTPGIPGSGEPEPPADAKGGSSTAEGASAGASAGSGTATAGSGTTGAGNGTNGAASAGTGGGGTTAGGAVVATSGRGTSGTGGNSGTGNNGNGTGGTAGTGSNGSGTGGTAATGTGSTGTGTSSTGSGSTGSGTASAGAGTAGRGTAGTGNGAQGVGSANGGPARTGTGSNGAPSGSNGSSPTGTGSASGATPNGGTTVASSGTGGSTLVVPLVATPSTVAAASTDSAGPSVPSLMEKWRLFAEAQARLELDRDYTLGFLASRELRECRCPRINPSGITNALRADAGVAQIAADDSLNSRCEQCLLDAWGPWRSRADKQCKLMDQLSDYELSVLERSDDGNGLPPRCFEGVRLKRGGKPAVPGTAVASAGTPVVPAQPPAAKSVTINTPPAPAGPATVSSPIADSFVRSQDYAPVPTREDGRLYVRIFMSSACVADVLPGPLQARTGDLLLIPLAAKQLSVKSPCGGLAEVYWGREERPRVSEIFGRNQPLQLQFKPQ